MTRIALGFVLALILAPVANAGVPADPDHPVRAADGRFRDSRGGDVLLRGGNVISKRDGEPVIDERDVEVMRAVGWTTIRLGTGWRWFEPQRGVYDAAYADRFAAIARGLMDRGFRVIVDMHQDVWGPPMGNGAPEWAIPAECGPATDVNWSEPTGTWAADYFSPRTLCAFTNFWRDAELQGHLIEAYRMIARRLGKERRFVGIDLLNEPFQALIPPAVFEYGVLFPFYDRAAQAIRAVDHDALVFQEPSNSKNVAMAAWPKLAFASEGGAWAPHVYGPWDASPSAPQQRDELIRVSMQQSATEAELAGLPLWFGEFGVFNGAAGAEESMQLIYDTADELLAGTAMWELDDPSYGPKSSNGAFKMPRAHTVARGYPLRVGGALESVEFDSQTSALTVRWTQAGKGGDTVLVLPELRYPAALDVDAGPGVKVADREPGRLVLKAKRGARSVTVAPG